MMVQEIEENQKNLDNSEKLTVVSFEPWNISNTNQLITQFFLRLSNELRSKGDKNLAKIGDAIQKYSVAFKIAELIPK